MIEVSAVFKKLSGTEVLRGVSLSLERGRFLALIGPSGSGKSVLLKHLAGLIRPDRGHVLIDGVDVGATRGRDLEQLRRRFGFLFQNGALFDSLTSYDNIAFPLREKTDLEEDEIREKVSFVLEEVGLAGTEDKYPSELSGGMVKRTARW
jgi:phospholipid/cholesterol/gamma-HCH transport system ATP-binding protein